MMIMAPNRILIVSIHWTPPSKRKRGRSRTPWRRTITSELERQTKDNMEEDNYIRAGGNGFFYGPSSVRCKGQKKMVTNC